MKRTWALLPTVVAAISFERNGRQYFPAGYADGTTFGVPDLYGYGFGTLEVSFYDAEEKLFYGGSELGFITISDFSKYPEAHVLDVGFPLDTRLTDLTICGDLLFFTTLDDPNPGFLHIYRKSIRQDDGTFSVPTKIQTVTVGIGPDSVLANKNCTIVATANEGEGDYDDDLGLIDPVGSVSILRAPFDDPANPPSNTLVSLNKWTDAELLEKGIHLPLSFDALVYWSEYAGIDFNASTVIESYTPDMNLEPEYLAWADGESKLLVNVQENNGLIVIDVATNEVLDIYSYGLKTGFPVDILQDGGCENMPTVDGLYFLRSADSIATFEKDGTTFVITANEGADIDYGDFEEHVRGEDIFVGASLGFSNMTADSSIFVPGDITAGFSRYFNGDCDTSNEATPWCSPDFRMSLGSAMVDYSNPEAPNIYRMVGIGGRGITIYELTDSGLNMVYDSGDAFEREGCAAFPWAHNAIQDEEFSPVGGAFYNSLDIDDDLRETIEELNDPDEDGCIDGGNGEPGACPLSGTVDEQSEKNGPAVETVVVGEACGKTYLATSSEKNSIGFLYDVSDPSATSLVKVFHLSPVSKSLNVGLAYDARTLGEIDAESVQFLSAEESPTGKPAVIFSGAYSGSVSLWEFDCDDNDTEDTENDISTPPPETVGSTPLPSTGDDSSAGLRGMISWIAAAVAAALI